MSADAPSPAALEDLDAIKCRRNAVVRLTHILSNFSRLPSSVYPMSIPPRPEDADMLLIALCADVDALLAAARRGGEDTELLERTYCLTAHGVLFSVTGRELLRSMADGNAAALDFAARSAAHPEVTNGE